MGIYHWFHRLPAKAGWIAAFLYVISQIGIGMVLGSKVGSELIQLQLSFTKSAFDKVVGTWGPEEVVRYGRHFYLDFLHPLWYGFLLAFLIARTIPRERGWFVFAPLAASTCDLLENIVHAGPAFRGTFTELHQPSIALAATFASLKWLLVAVSLAVIGYHSLRQSQSRSEE